MKFYLRIQAKKRNTTTINIPLYCFCVNCPDHIFFEFFQAQINILPRISCYDIFGQLSLIFHVCFLSVFRKSLTHEKGELKTKKDFSFDRKVFVFRCARADSDGRHNHTGEFYGPINEICDPGGVTFIIASMRRIKRS